jgi:crossover junction endodeoxyribonuclease RusA
MSGFVEISRESALKVDQSALVIELPFPPSVNHYWGTRVVGKGKRAFIQRYVAAAGQKFKQAVHEQFLVDDIRQKFSGPLACTVELYPPCNRRRDCDNYCKGLLDALGSAGLYDDDSQIIELHIRMHAKRAPGSVRVTIEPTRDEQCAHNQIDLLEVRA